MLEEEVHHKVQFTEGKSSAERVVRYSSLHFSSLYCTVQFIIAAAEKVG